MIYSLVSLKMKINTITKNNKREKDYQIDKVRLTPVLSSLIAQLVKGVCVITTKGLIDWVRVALQTCLIRMVGIKCNNTWHYWGKPTPGLDNTRVGLIDKAMNERSKVWNPWIEGIEIRNWFPGFVLKKWKKRWEKWRKREKALVFEDKSREKNMLWREKEVSG